MTTWLVCCDHHRQVISAPSMRDAMMTFQCKRCVSCDLKTGTWKFKDVRFYQPTDADRAAIKWQEPAKTKRLKSTMHQLDWVDG